MLKRIITSAVGIIIAIVILYFSDTMVLNYAVSVAAFIMVYEMLGACKCLQYRLQSVICLTFAAVAPVLVDVEGMLITYGFASFCIFGLFAGYIRVHKRLSFDRLCVMIASTLLVALSMTCLVSLRRLSIEHGVCYVVLALAGAWLGDSGAYFTGTFIGKRKLCPEISPKKTVEGAIGGIITVALVFAVYAFCYRYVLVQIWGHDDFRVNYPVLVVMALCCGGLGIVGDLSASLIKRQNDVKDFGSIMPGHGGLMDRFDSVLFVLPFMTFVLDVNRIEIFI